MRYEAGKTIAYERPSPGETGRILQSRSCVLEKPGRGTNWAYVEVKCYGPSGKKAIAADIEKLRGIRQRSQRWILCYRVRPRLTEKKRGKKAKTLQQLLAGHFPKDLKMTVSSGVPTIGEDLRVAVCDIVLAEVL